ncbi:MAG: DUF481 domain-containing protein [bacterium]
MKRTIITCVVLCGVAVAAVAADEKPAGQFKTMLSAGVSLTGGNSETLSANGALTTEGEKEGLGSVRVGLEAKYGESTVADVKDTTVETAKTYGNVKKTITPMTFGYIDGLILYDAIAKIDYRVTVGPGLGCYLLKDDQLTLSVEAGGSYVWDKLAGESENHLALRVAERCTYAPSGTVKFWQSAEYLPSVDELSDYMMTAELGAESAMSARMSLRVVLQDKYDSTPVPGLKNNDLALIAGISVSL